MQTTLDSLDAWVADWNLTKEREDRGFRMFCAASLR